MRKIAQTNSSHAKLQVEWDKNHKPCNNTIVIFMRKIAQTNSSHAKLQVEWDKKDDV